jgi:hypothetical protein
VCKLGFNVAPQFGTWNEAKKLSVEGTIREISTYACVQEITKSEAPSRAGERGKVENCTLLPADSKRPKLL